MTSTRGRVVLLMAIALAIAVGVAFVYSMSPTDRGNASVSLPTTTVPSPGAGATPATPTAVTPTAVTPTATDRPPTPSARATRAPGTGPGLTEIGIHVIVQPDTDGDLEVVEQVLLARPVLSIGLAPPVPPAYPGVEGLTPQVVALQAESRGVPVAVGLSDPLVTREELRLGPTTSLSLRYRLVRTSHRTEPSTLGRALAVLPAISAGDYPDLPVVIEVVGPGVRNVLCTQLTGDQRFCAVQVGQTWTTVDLTGRQVAVVAQLDLPAPG